MINKLFTTPADDQRGWFTSSYTNSGGSCVEVKFVIGATLVRDSKDRRHDRPVAEFSTAGWSSFLNTVTGRAES